MIALPRIVDVRHEQALAAPRSDVRGGRTVQRDPSTVTGVCLHQTATLLPPGPRRLRAADGDRDLAEARRALPIPAHVTAYRSGVVAVPHPLTSYLWHAGRLNGSTLGMEVEGRYPGLAVLRDQHPDRWDPWDVQTALSARLGLVWLVTQGRAAGMPLRWLWAHRQSSATRRADPGEEIYAALLPLARELGLTPRWADTVGDGRPVPRQWIAESTARY